MRVWAAAVAIGLRVAISANIKYQRERKVMDVSAAYRRYRLARQKKRATLEEHRPFFDSRKPSAMHEGNSIDALH